MFKIVIFCISLYGASAYFTLPDKCPENVNLQEYFRLQDFYDTWYQAYHFASDGQQKNNCSTLKLLNTPTGIYLNQSRVDRGLFHRYSLGKLEIPSDIEKGSNLDITFTYQNAPRRIYVWILSRTPSLNEVSKTLAIKPLSQIGVDPETLVKDDNSNCAPKYYSDEETEPMTFRYPVPI
ncbi:uncharacterized protein LOC128682702 isoform X2 [Plodia interpunctella]|uniref:uncharacterized protein LOC128677087 isoform X2 n=1 Tax=Plodia interpunctella TaxID=58824 RepID=UPI002368A606|nr:uncharacterized protein LOC128677087 isoform X2 [Plodia interpunctella]XP_053614019.1 uncharacterized protein LOC128677298 isoform X2 [Plodia interpunctella]XP_053623525.1 uncharacterized protein LOC128682702 isoform X2 [Plodia interpunctella]